VPLWSPSSRSNVNDGYRGFEEDVRKNWEEDGNREGDELFHAYCKAASWYHVTYHPDFLRLGGREDDGQAFLSFPWIAAKYLTQIKYARVCERAGGHDPEP
jgi:hypothetical protein